MKQVANSPQYKQRGNWAQLTFAKTCGTISRGTGKKRPNGDQRLLSNYPRNNCGTHLGSSSLLVPKWRMFTCRWSLMNCKRYSALTPCTVVIVGQISTLTGCIAWYPALRFGIRWPKIDDKIYRAKTNQWIIGSYSWSRSNDVTLASG